MKSKAQAVLGALFALFCAVFLFASCSTGERLPPVVREDQLLRVCTTMPGEVYIPLFKEFTERTGIWLDVTSVDSDQIEEAFASDSYDFFFGGSSEYYYRNAQYFAALALGDQLYDNFRASGREWFGFTYDPVVFVYNKTENAIKDAPVSWEELLELDLSQIAFADIGASDAAMSTVIEFLQHCSQSETNRYIAAIFGSDAVGYCKSLSDVAEAVSSGRYMIGVVTESIAWGFNDLYLIYPEDSTMAIVEGAAVSLHARNLSDACRLAEFLLDSDAQTYLSQVCGLRPTNASVPHPKGYVAFETLRLTPYELGWVYEKKRSILSYWMMLAEAR